MREESRSILSYLWKGTLSTIGAISAICIILGASEIPEWIERWGQHLQTLQQMNVNWVNVIAVAIGMVIVVLTNIPWISLAFRRLRIRREVSPATSESAEESQQATSPATGFRVVDKARSIDGAREMIQELIDSKPSEEKLNRQDVGRWRDRCIRTMQGLLDDTQQDAWLVILAKLALAEDASVDSPQELRGKVHDVVIHLRTIRNNMNLTWLRKSIRMDSDNYASMNTHQEREAKERLERLERARNRIRKLAEMINVSGITITPALTIGPKKDWKAETKRELRAIVRADICKEYENILRLDEPERSAKRFLEALADTLSHSHLIA